MPKIEQRDIRFKAVGAAQLADNLDLSAKSLTLPVFTTPGMPAFHARSSQATAPGNDVSEYTILFNRGNGLNATNGRFTAPISGTYFLKWNQLTASGPSGEFRTAIYVNGTGYGGLGFIAFRMFSWRLSLIAEGHLYLNAGDYATIRYESGPSALHTDGNYGSFSGHFLG
jgi:hypothetical protein